MKLKPVLILTLLLCLTFASLKWQVKTDGAITTKPLVVGNALVVGSADGNLYAVEPSTGNFIYKGYMGKYILQPVKYSNGVFVATTDGSYYQLDPQGSKVWEGNITGEQFNATYIYGFAVQGTKVVLATDNGIFILVPNQDPEHIYKNIGPYTTPYASGDYIIFGEGGRLVRIDFTGRKSWETSIAGQFWLSSPVLSGSNIFIGALDKNMHSFYLGSGYKQWSVPTTNWVLGDALVSEGTVYFGSNDGKVYAVDETLGNVKWTAAARQAIQTTPEAGFMGGRKVIFAGSNDNHIYAVDALKGEIVWKGSASGWVGDPLYHQNTVIFGSKDGTIYAYTTERACSITSPLEGDIVGYKEVVIQGRAVSEMGSPTVLVRINNGQWEQATRSPEGNWTYYADPAKTMNAGLNTIYCKVRDAAGEETGTYTNVGIIRNTNLPKGTFTVATKGKRIAGQNFTIYILDAEDGSAVDRFKLKIGDIIDTQGDGNISVTIDEPGSYTMTVSKAGFNDASLTLDVAEEGIPVLYMAVGGVIILVLLILIVRTVMKRKK